ncbi:MAG: tetratricopeptide repeat protein [Desulfobacterales bacterium]|nr:tetratricopeptide repeat protein [Desulfobacterales bacterium]
MPLGKKIQFFLLLTIIGVVFAPLQSRAQKEEQLPYPAHVILNKANDFLEKKEIQKAIEVIQSFQTQGSPNQRLEDPDPKGYHHYLIYFTLGNCYLMLDQPAKAVPNYQNALKKKPDFSPAWVNLAKSYYDLNKPIDAAKSFLKGYETKTEKKADLLYYSAASFMVAEDNKKALEIFERLLSLHPNDIKIEWKESLVQAYLACEMPLKALPFIKELTEKTTGKKQTQWQEVLLYQYISLKMKDKALSYAKELTCNYPLEPKWWKAITHLHLSENRYQEALINLTVYKYLTPLSEQEKKLMADLHMALGIPIQAARLYEEIISDQKEKTDVEIVKQLAQSYLSLYKPQQALESIEKGINLFREDTDLLLLKGRIFYQMERYPEAIEVFEKITTHSKAIKGDVWLMLGYSALKADQIEKARYAFKEALKYSNQKKSAQKFLLQLERKNI